MSHDPHDSEPSAGDDDAAGGVAGGHVHGPGCNHDHHHHHHAPRVPVRAVARPGRNEPCWCGSGKKYKRCHLASDPR